MPPWAKGLQDSVAIPCLAWNARSSRWANPGCSSIWFTAGTTLDDSISRSRLACVKLDTPIERARPSSFISTMARQASRNFALPATGQWIR
ncbi:hypothetical protein G6F65_022692 [Rhizopus arrhizus]|nr:hypothetical protein G6F65_022692 [Rhizopus arrhizus]